MSICSSIRRIATLAAATGLLLLAGSSAPAAGLTAEPAPATAAGAQAQPQAPADPKAEAALKEARSLPARAASAPPAPNQPPDGVWLVDEEGAEYYVEKMQRYEGKYKFLSETRVKYLGVEVDIVGHDADWFYVKVYRTGPPVEPEGPLKPTPEALAEVSASYQVAVPTVDLLQLVPFDKGLPGTGQWRNGFEIADMNGDGHPDIVHGPPRKGGSVPIIFLGDGAGGWKVWQEASFPAAYDYGDVAVGDFNGDAKPDIALGIHLRGLRILVGDGKGSFSEWSEGVDYEVPGRGGSGTGFSSRTVLAVDWDGDGRQDVLALGEGPRASAGPRSALGGSLFVADGPAVFLNQGNGTWRKAARTSDASQLFGDDLALGDFNGDGRIDFATSSSRMGRRDLVNLGGEGAEWQPTEVPSLRPNLYVRAVTAADFDRDGRDDLAVSYLAFELALWHSGIDLFYSRPDGSWERRALFAREGRDAVYAIDHGDLNGDGALDLAGVDSEGEVLFFLGDGDGFFRSEEAAEASQPRGRCRGYHIELADLDGDGRDEVVVAFADEANAMFDPDRCPSGGGMTAWRAAAQEIAAAEAPSAP